MAGETGMQGQTGIRGLMGLQGSKGATGLQGATGAGGGVGTQGTTGLMGITGIFGITGLTGVTGLSGSQGTTGLVGNTGSQGIQGITGLIGSTGISGPVGQTGITGQTGVYVSDLIFENNQSSNYTLSLSDRNMTVVSTGNNPVTFTVPTNSLVPFPIGSQIGLCQDGTGQLTINGPGVTIKSESGLIMNAQYAMAGLVKIATDTWRLCGSLKT